MSTLSGMGDGLQAAWLLARGRPEGLAVLSARAEPAMATAARSFWAAALCLPAFVCLQLMSLTGTSATAFSAHTFALQLEGYALDWAAFALVSRSLAMVVGQGEKWPVFIAALNWCNVIQFVLLVAAGLPSLLGLPDFVGETVWLVVYGWSLWLEWYVSKLSLDIDGMSAVGFVVLDEALGLILLMVIQGIGGA